MKFISLKKAITIKSSLRRYNRRFRTSIIERDLFILLVIQSINWPVNRARILYILSKTGHSINYKQMDQSLNLLFKQGFLSYDKIPQKKKVIITPTGIAFLATIETWSRRFRFDKIF